MVACRLESRAILSVRACTLSAAFVRASAVITWVIGSGIPRSSSMSVTGVLERRYTLSVVSPWASVPICCPRTACVTAWPMDAWVMPSFAAFASSTFTDNMSRPVARSLVTLVTPVTPCIMVTTLSLVALSCSGLLLST